MSDELKFHPLADMFPLMEGAEFDELVADIKANGLRQPIVTYEGMILDGRNRYRALRALGADLGAIRDQCCVTRDCIHNHGGPAAYVISANIHRRHLTGDQRRDYIAALIKAQPEKSDRQIAKTVKASHHTVGAVRADMEGRGQVAHVDTRTDTKGRKQPARKGWSEERFQRHRAKKKAKPDEAENLDEYVASPEVIERNLRDWIARHHAGAEAARKVVKASHLEDGVRREIGLLIERLISKWKSVQRALAPAASGADDPIASADAMKAKFAGLDLSPDLDIPDTLLRAPKAVAS